MEEGEYQNYTGRESNDYIRPGRSVESNEYIRPGCTEKLTNLYSVHVGGVPLSISGVSVSPSALF